MPTKKNFLGGQQNYDPKSGKYEPSLVGKDGKVAKDADGDGKAHESWDYDEESQTYTSKEGEVFSKKDYESKFGDKNQIKADAKYLKDNELEGTEDLNPWDRPDETDPEYDAEVDKELQKQKSGYDYMELSKNTKGVNGEQYRKLVESEESDISTIKSYGINPNTSDSDELFAQHKAFLDEWQESGKGNDAEMKKVDEAFNNLEDKLYNEEWMREHS